MSIQKVINICESLNIDRRKVVGVQYTRSEIAKVSSTPTRNPWRFNLKVPSGLQYSTNRDLVEEIDRLDRQYTETVSFSGVAGHSFIFAYQGSMTAGNVAGLRVDSFTGTNLVLNTLPSVAASVYMFKKGDILQLVGFPHPFTATADVLRGTGTTVTVPVHRPNFISSAVGLGIAVGNAVQFKVFCPNMPTYRLIRGGSDALIEWTSEFQLFEYTGDVS